jgi:hypothetical protein
MKRIIRLTESDLTRIIKRVISEKVETTVLTPGQTIPLKITVNGKSYDCTFPNDGNLVVESVTFFPKNNHYKVVAANSAVRCTFNVFKDAVSGQNLEILKPSAIIDVGGAEQPLNTEATYNNVASYFKSNFDNYGSKVPGGLISSASKSFKVLDWVKNLQSAIPSTPAK